MSNFTIPIKDESLKTQIETAFLNTFSAGGLTGEELVIARIQLFLRNTLNEYLVNTAISSAAPEDSGVSVNIKVKLDS